ncbi:hypothetical protein EON81_06855 [bacterium]|nr:MAG: hypothetical protein EON81_06855 [bacterium]
MFEDLSAKANDAKREIRLQGPKDSVAQALDMIRLVDVERRKVTATIRIISPIDSLDMRMVSTMSANVPMEFAEPESKTKLTVAIRPNAGESFTVFVASGESEKSKTSVVFRVNGSEKTRLMVANGKFRIVNANEIPSGDIVLIEFSVAPIGSPTKSGA